MTSQNTFQDVQTSLAFWQQYEALMLEAADRNDLDVIRAVVELLRQQKDRLEAITPDESAIASSVGDLIFTVTTQAAGESPVATQVTVPWAVIKEILVGVSTRTTLANRNFQP